MRDTIRDYNKKPGPGSSTVKMIAVRNRDKVADCMRTTLGLGPEVKHRDLFPMMNRLQVDEDLVDVAGTRGIVNSSLGCLVNLPVGMVEHPVDAVDRGRAKWRLELVYDDIFVADAQMIRSMDLIINAQMNGQVYANM